MTLSPECSLPSVRSRVVVHLFRYEVARLDAEHPGDTWQLGNVDAPPPPFQLTLERPVNANEVGELFLAEPALGALQLEVESEGLEKGLPFIVTLSDRHAKAVYDASGHRA